MGGGSAGSRCCCCWLRLHATCATCLPVLRTQKPLAAGWQQLHLLGCMGWWAARLTRDARGELPVRQGVEGVDVDQDAAWLVEGANHVLAQGVVHARLAPNCGVGVGQVTGSNLAAPSRHRRQQQPLRRQGARERTSRGPRFRTCVYFWHQEAESLSD